MLTQSMRRRQQAGAETGWSTSDQRRDPFGECDRLVGYRVQRYGWRLKKVVAASVLRCEAAAPHQSQPVPSARLRGAADPGSRTSRAAREDRIRALLLATASSALSTT